MNELKPAIYVGVISLVLISVAMLWNANTRYQEHLLDVREFCRNRDALVYCAKFNKGADNVPATTGDGGRYKDIIDER